MLGLIAGFAFSDRPFWNFIGQMTWGPSSSFVLVAVPLFLLMGEIMLRAGLSDKLYRALNVWLHRLPGGLLHTNIVSSGVFSAYLGLQRRDRRDDGLGRPALLPQHRLRPAHGAGLARRGRRAGQPDPARHHLHRLRPDHRDLRRRAVLAAIGPSILVVLLFTALILVHGVRKPQARGGAGAARRKAEEPWST